VLLRISESGSRHRACQRRAGRARARFVHRGHGFARADLRRRRRARHGLLAGATIGECSHVFDGAERMRMHTVAPSFHFLRRLAARGCGL